MHSNTKLLAIGIIVVALLLAGCVGTGAPRGWLSTAAEAQKESKGAWIKIEYFSGASKSVVRGEFIAVNTETVYVDTLTGLVAISLSDIKKARLATYDSRHGNLAVWTLLGTLSTASHGVGLLLSAPVWIIGGSIAAAAQSHKPIESFPDSDWNELKKFARFPHGLPEGFEHNVSNSMR